MPAKEIAPTIKALENSALEKKTIAWLALQIQNGKLGADIAIVAREKFNRVGKDVDKFVSDFSYSAAEIAVFEMQDSNIRLEKGFTFDADTLTVCTNGVEKGVCLSLELVRQFIEFKRSGKSEMNIGAILRIAVDVARNASDPIKRDKVLQQNGISKASIRQLVQSLPSLWKADNLGGFTRSVQDPTSTECQRMLDSATIVAFKDKDDFVKKAVEEEEAKREKRRGKNA